MRRALVVLVVLLLLLPGSSAWAALSACDPAAPGCCCGPDSGDGPVLLQACACGCVAVPSVPEAGRGVAAERSVPDPVPPGSWTALYENEALLVPPPAPVRGLRRAAPQPRALERRNLMFCLLLC